MPFLFAVGRWIGALKCSEDLQGKRPDSEQQGLLLGCLFLNSHCTICHNLGSNSCPRLWQLSDQWAYCLSIYRLGKYVQNLAYVSRIWPLRRLSYPTVDRPIIKFSGANGGKWKVKHRKVCLTSLLLNLLILNVYSYSNYSVTSIWNEYHLFGNVN